MLLKKYLMDTTEILLYKVCDKKSSAVSANIYCNTIKSEIVSKQKLPK